MEWKDQEQSAGGGRAFFGPRIGCVRRLRDIPECVTVHQSLGGEWVQQVMMVSPWGFRKKTAAVH